MKRFVLILILLTCLFSCSKNNGISPDEKSVNINGMNYPVVLIGGQEWTSVNYSGPGGFTNPNGSSGGNYYTQAQALAISLPSGWRLPTMQILIN